MGIVGYVKLAAALGLISVVVGGLVALRMQANTIEANKKEIERLGNEVLKANASIKTYKDVIDSLPATQAKFDELKVDLERSLSETKNAIIRKIPAAARDPDCGVSREFVLDAIRTVRTGSGLPTTHMDRGEVPGLRPPG